MTQVEMIERHRQVNRMSWADHDMAKKEAAKRHLSSWSDARLTERYHALLDLVPDCPPDLRPYSSPTAPHFRVDDGYMAWMKKYNQEVIAISHELSARR